MYIIYTVYHKNSEIIARIKPGSHGPFDGRQLTGVNFGSRHITFDGHTTSNGVKWWPSNGPCEPGLTWTQSTVIPMYSFCLQLIAIAAMSQWANFTSLSLCGFLTNHVGHNYQSPEIIGLLLLKKNSNVIWNFTEQCCNKERWIDILDCYSEE